MAWSSGKDAAWALHLTRQSDEMGIVGLLTTVSDAFGRVSMHGVRETLLEAQAAALGLPLHRVSIPTPCSDEIYGVLMRASLAPRPTAYRTSYSATSSWRTSVPIARRASVRPA